MSSFSSTSSSSSGAPLPQQQVAMVTLSSGKRKCPTGYTQRPRKSGRCAPSSTTTRRRPLSPPTTHSSSPSKKVRTTAALQSSPLPGSESSSPLLSRPPLPASLGSELLLSLPPLPPESLGSESPPPLLSRPPLPASLGSELLLSLPPLPASPGSESPPLPPLPRAQLANNAAPVIAAVRLASGKFRCPLGYIQRPPGSGRCVPSTRKTAAPVMAVNPLPGAQPLLANNAAPVGVAVRLASGKFRCPLGHMQRPPGSGRCVPSTRKTAAPVMAVKTPPSSVGSSSASNASSSSASSSSASNASSSSSSSSSSASNASSSSSSSASNASSSSSSSSSASNASVASSTAYTTTELAAERVAYLSRAAEYERALARDPTRPFDTGTADVDLFPDHDDPLFSMQLARRLEFEGATYDGTVAPVAQRAEEVCHAPFEIAPNQRFVQTLLSPDSPLNAVFLYNELGTGKTTAAQTISEEFRRTNKAGGVRRPIYVVANPNVLDNFKKQLFDPADLRANPATAELEMPPGTIADEIMREIGGSGRGLDRGALEERAQRVIRGAYVFIGYTAFASRVHELALGSPSSYSNFATLKLKSDGKKRLRANFDNSLIIVDEAHNINQREYGKGGNNAAAMDLVTRYCTIKLLMMSATPMFNNYRELIPLVNLLNLVDRRAPIRASQVFDTNGRLLETAPEGSDESGRELLTRKLTGYVSFVRGETPYAFPFRLLPDTFLDMSDPADAAHRLQQYPTRTINGTPLPAGADVKLQLFVTAMPTYQRRAYLALVAKLLGGKKESQSEESQSEESQSEESQSEESQSESQQSEESQSEESQKTTTTENTTDEEEEELNEEDIVLAELPVGAAQVVDERQEGYNYDKLRPLMYMSMIVYPSRAFDQHFAAGGSVATLDIGVLRGMSGVFGLKRMLTHEGGGRTTGDNAAGHAAMRNFRYRDTNLAPHERVFASENLSRYSAKIAALVERVRSSSGVVLVYSFYVDASIIPIALALEQAGIMGVEGVGATATDDDPIGQPRPLWHASELAGVVPMMVPAEGGMPAARACYTMITGRASLSSSNADNVRLAVSAANAYGHRVKVVLYTAAGTESTDYKCARQMHPMEPWFNFSRMEQVVGRAVRNRSHCRLPFAQRNTEVYYHAAVLGGGGAAAADVEADVAFFAGDAKTLALVRESAADMETVDQYQYRWCEDKDRIMAPLRRLMKETSVDCVANRGQQNFTQETMGQSVQLELSSRRRTVQFSVGDRPFSSMCDYSGDCRYQCHAPSESLRAATNGEAGEAVASASATRMTYGPRALKRDEMRLVRRIQDLYRERAYYRFTDLRARLSVQRRVPEWQVYTALQALLHDPALRLVNESGLPGRLVAVRDSSPGGGRQMWYLFQPTHMSDPRASVFERRSLAVDQPRVVQFSRAETIAPPAAAAAVAASADAAATTVDDVVAVGVLGSRPPPTPADAGRARLAPRMLAHIFAHVVFAAAANHQKEKGDGGDTAAAAAVRNLVPSDWYAEVGRIVSEAPSAVITRDAVAWVVAQYFLDSRPVEERMCILRDLLQEMGGLSALLQEGKLQITPPQLGPLQTWSARVRRCLARYFAERVYLPPNEEDDETQAVAVMVDMTAGKAPRMVAWILAETESMQPRTMETAADDGEWLKAAVHRRNPDPVDTKKVAALRERNLTWPVVIHCLEDKYLPGAWNAAMKVRVKTLTDTRINYNGGQDLSSLKTDVVLQMWRDARARVGGGSPESEALTAAGNAVLEDTGSKRKGHAASSAFSLLMGVAEARGLGNLSAMTGERYAVSSLAARPANARRRRK